MIDEEWEDNRRHGAIVRLAMALAEAAVVIDRDSPMHLPIRQTRDLLDLWNALSTDESRESALDAFRSFSARDQH